MGTLIVKDLKVDKELDRKAMLAVYGGRRFPIRRPRRKRYSYISLSGNYP
ncbi:MAG: hypothetical protein V7629_16545 [Motiliproteus sp.]